MKKKILIIIIVVLLFGSTFFLSGCTDPTPVSPDTTQAFSLTDDLLLQSYQKGCEFLNQSITENGFFIEAIDVSTNTTLILPDLLLQIQTISDLSLKTHYPKFQQQHEQLCAFIEKIYFPLDNTSQMQAFIDQSDSSLLAAISYLLQTNPGIKIYTMNTFILNNAFHTRYVSRSSYSTADNTKHTIIDDCLTLSLMIAINAQSETNRFSDSLITKIHTLLSETIHTMDQTTPYYQVLPIYAQTLYDLYKSTGNQSYATEHITLSQDLLNRQQHTKYFGHFLIDGDLENPGINTTVTAYCTQAICQAYLLTKDLGDTLHQTAFEAALFQGIYALLQMQENTTELPRIYGGFYAESTKEIITLEPIKPFFSIYHLLIASLNDTSWSYLSDGTQGYLSITNTEEQPLMLWYLLSLGVILSVIFLFILYGMLRFLKKRKR